MNGLDFTLRGAKLTALPSGALWWSDERLLCVSDLHLGKSDRMARRGGALLPPYEVQDTLAKLDAAIAATRPTTVVCLGDTFDDLAAADSLREDDRMWISRLAAGRRWIWIEGNHDPGPIQFGGEHLQTLSVGPLQFRHIAAKGATAEVSGHYHPKAALPRRGVTRPCFLIDDARLILPAFGTYTGGLKTSTNALCDLMAPNARAILLATPPVEVPMPRAT
ncbi:ligase-associated DNA damage response endonuclease PdeM [Aliiroseovarius sp. YM-037]|uniref:ligase-associated DNA damage response endonuclease PdeM n=1 Tax=Aliiroseovarius sp. YM-037 TaxID=3341728 RepID=UPI003A811585